MTKLEKTIVFRHYRYISCLNNGEPEMMEKEMKKQLVNDQLKKGYIPAGLEFKEVEEYLKCTDIKPTKYYILKGYCGYAGKKSARIIYEKQKEMFEKFNYDVVHIPLYNR